MVALKKNTLFLLLATAIYVSCSKSDKTSKPIYPTDCAHSLAGIYSGSDFCSGSSPITYACTVMANTPTNVTFSNLYGARVTAELDCNTNRITIPTQQFSYFSISGTGN